MMSNIKISGSSSLEWHISQLKAERETREKALSQSFNDLVQFIFNPGKSSKPAESGKKDIKRDLINFSKVVVNQVSDYIIEQRFGRPQKKGDLYASILIELFSIPLMQKSITKLFPGISRDA